jgi:hypothetical protein
MTILDNQGRLFGRVSILDLGALLVIVLVLIGIFLVPGSRGSVAQVGGATKPVEVDLIVRGVVTTAPDDLLKTLQSGETPNIIVRNQPSGSVKLLKVEVTPNSIPVPQPDGSVVALPDPRPEVEYITDFLITMGGQAQVTDNGVVIGGSKLKIGASVELEGKTYTISGKVAKVTVLDQ